MSNRHWQSAESYDLIRDKPLREFVREAVTRADQLDWPLFLALDRDGPESAVCFDAAWARPLSEFLCSCARQAFSGVRSLPDDGSRIRLELLEIPDTDLHGAFVSAILRAGALNRHYFFDLAIALPGWSPKNVAMKCACCLPPERVQHLHRCFEIALMASFAGAPGIPSRDESFAN